MSAEIASRCELGGSCMGLRHLYALGTIALVVAKTAAATVYEGIDFPHGDTSFADAVLTIDRTSAAGWCRPIRNT